MNTELLLKQEEDLFESLIDGLLQNQYGFTEQFLDPQLLEGLRNNLLQHKKNGEMYPAGIGKRFDYQKNTMVRGDVIQWIDENTTDIFERAFLGKINRFISYLNKTCYTSINASEFHYASYEVNSFYKKHLDQFKSEKGRKFSLVIYLNNDWKTTDGGKLSLFLQEHKIEEIYPLANRAVFFKSDELEHEVHPSFTKSRISIAGWLKSV